MYCWSYRARFYKLIEEARVCIQYSNYATGWSSEEPGFDFRLGARELWVHQQAQPSIRWLRGLVPRGWRGRSVKLITRVHGDNCVSTWGKAYFNGTFLSVQSVEKTLCMCSILFFCRNKQSRKQNFSEAACSSLQYQVHWLYAHRDTEHFAIPPIIAYLPVLFVSTILWSVSWLL